MPDGNKLFRNQFYEICKTQKKKTAITYIKKDQTLVECSYEQMKDRVENIIEKYTDIGINNGDRVVVLIPLSDNVYLDILALACIGATAVILDFNLHKSELFRIIDDSDPACIITTEDIFTEKLQEIDLPILESSDECHFLKKRVLEHTKDPNYDAIAILYSSGTTSQAKGVVIGYEQEINAFNRLYKVIGSNNVNYLMLFPTSHISGLTSFLVVLMRGGSLAVLEESSAIQLMNGFQIYKPNCFGMVPKIWDTYKGKIEDSIKQKGVLRAKIINGMIKCCGTLRYYTGINLGRKFFHSINKQVFGGRLQQIYSGGGKTNPDTSRFFWNLGYDFFDFYASTEANIPIVVTDGIKYMKSIGNINEDPNSSVRISNPDNNGVGEIQVKSNMLMLEYFHSPELTQSAFDGEYFKTGDYGRIENEELYITGRIKESIHLSNGEKVSPEDIENSYKESVGQEIEFAVTGIKSDDGYDEVYVFAVGKSGQFDEIFQQVKQTVNANYRYKKIIYVDELPKTSVGKVKRYKLSTLVDKETNSGSIGSVLEDNVNNIESIENWLCHALSKYTDCNITKDKKISSDLGIDSLSMFELCVDIDNKFKICAENFISQDLTITELAKLISGQNKKNDDNKYSNNSIYPVPKDKKLERRLQSWIRFVKFIYRIEITGIENVPSKGNYIICSNHESYFDPLWILAALGEQISLKEVCCMAAKHTMNGKISKKLFDALGGIPVDREGNTIPAMNNAKRCLGSGRVMIIFPEGARSRDGTMLPFKNGAAQLALDTNTKILPIEIEGGFETFPRWIKYPRLFDWKHLKKYTIKIKIGSLIDPSDKSVFNITNQIRQEIIDMHNIKEKVL